MYVESLKSLATLCHDKTLWITVTGAPIKSIYDILVAEIEDIFQMPDLLKPLRSAMSIVKYAYPEFRMI